MKQKLVFLDAETDGLYGSFLTVAFIATDIKGNELERAYYGIRKEKMIVKEPWVIKNVLPILGEYEPCEDEKELLTKSWAFWLKYQEDAYAVCDVGYPVEMRFFKACVEQNITDYAMKAPFPLLDISSMLYAKGYNPLIDRSQFVPEFCRDKVHNSLYDVEVSVQIWRQLKIGEILEDE